MQRTFVPLVLITAALIGARVAAQHGYTQAQVADIVAYVRDLRARSGKS